MLTGIGFTHEMFKFPVGELHVRLKDYRPNSRVSIHFEFERTEELVELLLLADALKQAKCKIEGIAMPYIPFSRQDRVSVAGETFSLSVLANIINSIGADVVDVWDAHSDVATALIKNCNHRQQHEVFESYFAGQDGLLISPDGGALKKIYKLAQAVKLPVIECSKKRNVETGEINGVVVHSADLQGKDCYIVDDICDGGRTFIEIAKVLKTLNCGKIILMVTHGFFTKGLGVFDGIIDEIYTMKGKIK